MEELNNGVVQIFARGYLKKSKLLSNLPVERIQPPTEKLDKL
jgi:hypothetical protein